MSFYARVIAIVNWSGFVNSTTYYILELHRYLQQLHIEFFTLLVCSRKVVWNVWTQTRLSARSKEEYWNYSRMSLFSYGDDGCEEQKLQVLLIESSNFLFYVMYCTPNWMTEETWGLEREQHKTIWAWEIFMQQMRS